MSINTSLPVQLTSTAVTASADGKYSYDNISFLFPHEPLRRELLRGKKALEGMDLTAHPWKAKYLRVWLDEFLIPIIADHHDSEDKIFDPSYEKVGVKVPEKFVKDHAALVESLKTLSLSVHALIDHLQDGEQGSKLEGLRKEYQALFDLMEEHLADEERFWPEVIRQHGEDFYRQVHDAMHKEARNQASGKNFLMSVFDSMGYEFDPDKPIHNADDTRWCSEDLANEIIIQKIPYFVRSWIFPPYNRKYQYYKALVKAVADGKEDVLPLEYSESACTIC